MPRQKPAPSASALSDALGCGVLQVPQVNARLWLAWNEQALLRVSWQSAQCDAAAAFGAGHPPIAAIPEPYAGVFAAYLAREPVDPVQLPVAIAGTSFQAKVWRALREIGRGQVRSYAAIATAIGSPRAMRAVGGANGSNPLAIVVPCHRVVAADMSLGGYTGGTHFKRFLLELEGVRTGGDLVQPGQLDLL